MRTGPNTKYTHEKGEFYSDCQHLRLLKHITEEIIREYFETERPIYRWIRYVDYNDEKQIWEFEDKAHYIFTDFIIWVGKKYGFTCSICGKVHTYKSKTSWRSIVSIPEWFFQGPDFPYVPSPDIPSSLCCKCAHSYENFVVGEASRDNLTKYKHEAADVWARMWMIKLIQKEIRKNARERSKENMQLVLEGEGNDRVSKEGK